MAGNDKVLVFRPLGEHPPRTRMGDLELGKVHEISAKKAEAHAHKDFVQISVEDADVLRKAEKGDKDAAAKVPAVLARVKTAIKRAAEERATAAAKAAEEGAKAEQQPAPAEAAVAAIDSAPRAQRGNAKEGGAD